MLQTQKPRDRYLKKGVPYDNRDIFPARCND